jgi:acyl-coenzyme A thioesterase PaaI-like protein
MSDVSTADGGAEMRIEAHFRQPTRFLHGGVYAAMAEAVASGGTNWAVYGDGALGLGMENCTEFLRPLTGDLLREREGCHVIAAPRAGCGTIAVRQVPPSGSRN